MQDQATQTLTTIFSNVLADLAFMFAEDELGDTVPGGSWLETTIGYSGTSTGVLRLRCTQEFSIQLAANLLGLDPDDPETERSAHDAVKEFMNIVCGQFTTGAYGNEDVFNLTIPQVVELFERPSLTFEDGVESSVLSADGALIQLSHLPNQVPGAATKSGSLAK